MAPTFWRNLLPPSSGWKREPSTEKWHMIQRRENWNWGCEKKSVETMGPIISYLINWEKRKKHKKIEGGENKLTGSKEINKRKTCKRSRRK
jgi:hypothetical protein